MPSGEDTYTRKLSLEIDSAYEAYLQDEPSALYRSFRKQARNRIWQRISAYDEVLEHEIAVRAISALPSFRGGSRVSTWFFRIVNNEINRALRRRIKERRSSVPLSAPCRDGGEDDREDSPELLDEARKRESRIAQGREAKLILAKLGEGLPPEQVDVLSYL